MTAKKSYSTQLSFFQKPDSSIIQADDKNPEQLSILERSDDLSNQWQPLDTLALEIPYISQLEPLLEVVGGINGSSNQEPLIAARSRLGRILIDLYRIGESPPSRESWEKDSHSEEFKDAILLALIKGLAYNNKNNEIEDRDLRIRNDLRYQRVSDRIIRKLDGSYSIVTVTGSIRQIDTQTAEILMNFTEMDYLILQTIAVNLLESPDPIPLRSGIAEELIDTLHTLYQLAKSEDLPDEMFEARGLLLSSKRYFKILFCSDEFRSLDVYDTKYKNIPITIWIDEVIKNGVAFEGILNQNLRERSRLQLEINRYINSGFGRAIEEIVIDRIVEFTEENESDEQLEREGKNSSGLHTDQFQKFEGMHSQAVADCAKKVLITYAQRIITQSDSDLLPFYIDPSLDLREIVDGLIQVLGIDLNTGEFAELKGPNNYEKVERFTQLSSDTHMQRLHKAISYNTKSTIGWHLDDRARHEDHHKLLLEYLNNVYMQLITPGTRINKYLLSFFYGNIAIERLENWLPPEVFSQYHGLKTHIPSNLLSTTSVDSEEGPEDHSQISINERPATARPIPDLILIKKEKDEDPDVELSIDKMWAYIAGGGEFAIVEVKYLEGGDGQKIPNGVTEITRFQLERYLDAIYRLFYQPYGLKLSSGIKVKLPRIFNVVVTPFNTTTYEFSIDPNREGWRIETDKNGKPKIKRLR